FPGTWEIPSSPPDHSVWGLPSTKNSWSTDVAFWSVGAKTERNGGTAKRRQRSAAGRTAGSRSALIVPAKRGHGTARTAWREARRRIVEPLEGKTANASKFESRVNETTT